MKNTNKGSSSTKEWNERNLESVFGPGRSRSKSATYSLTATQRTRLLDSSQRSTQQAKNIRKKKVERLGHRIEETLEDVAILESAGVFGGGLDEWDDWDWESEWEDMLDVQNHTRRVDSNPVAGIGLSGSEADHRNLGIEVGKMFKMLTAPVENSEQYWLIWGLILGLLIDSPQPRRQPESGPEVEKLEEFLVWAGKRGRQWAQLAPQNQSSISEAQKRLDKHERILDDVIENFEITPTPQLRKSLDVEFDSPMTPYPAGYWENKKEEIVTELTCLICRSQLRKMDEFADLIQNDAEELNDESFQGDQVLPMFLHIHNSSTAQRYRDLPTDVDRSQGKFLLEFISGEKAEREDWARLSENWRRRPLLSKLRGGWETTNYGSLVGQEIEQSNVRNLLHRAAIPSIELEEGGFSLIIQAFFETH